MLPDEVMKAVEASRSPRVDALIERVMQKHPGFGVSAQARYYEAVHQELAPLARDLEARAERAESLLREVVAVAVTQLFDTHRTDVEATFSLAELQSMVELTEPLMEANTRVEAIYRKAFDFTAHLSENSRG